jgi:hypothetical protein
MIVDLSVGNTMAIAPAPDTPATEFARKGYPADQCFLKEDRKSRAFRRAALHELQFLPHPQDAASYPGDGRWRPTLVS